MTLFGNIQQYLLLKTTKEILIIEAVEVRGELVGEIYFNILLLNRHKNKIIILAAATKLDTEKLRDWLKVKGKSNVPVLLNFNSDKIIHKAVFDSIDRDSTVKELIHNADVDNFYVQFYSLNTEKTIVSVVRRNSVKDVLDYLSDLKESIIQFSIGPFSVLDTYKVLFLDADTDEVKLKFVNYYFSLNNNQLLDFSISRYSIDVDSVSSPRLINELTPNLVIPYSIGLDYFLQPLAGSGIRVNAVDENQREHNYRKISKAVGLMYLVLLLLGLLVSSAVFSVYNNRLNRLEFTATNKQIQWDRFQERLKVEKKSAEIYANNGLLKSSQLAFYADQISSEMPESIYLRKLEIHPINTKAAFQNISFSTEKIIIEGNCMSNIELDEWVSKLKAMQWVKNIVIKEYKDAEDIGSFTLNVSK